jgi:beta-glucosidase
MTRSTAATAVACLVLAFLLPSAASAKERVKYKDPKQSVNDRVQDLLSRMTLEEKIGQMSQIERANATTEVIEKYFVGESIDRLVINVTGRRRSFCSAVTLTNAHMHRAGSVLSGGGSVPAEKASASVWQKMVTKMQKAALKTRLGIPIIYGIDAVHGNNDVYNATIFPHNVGLGATRDAHLVKKIGEATAHETRATGIPYTFAPCVAVRCYCYFCLCELIS